jgi:DNA invertase Pin-like site-specific DNA recombinase
MQEKQAMKVAIYARVSTEDQACGLQLSELRKYATDRGWQVVDEYIDYVTGDVRKRIKGAKRYRYDDLFDDAEKHRFEAVLVWKFDRFARSTAHLHAALERFQDLGIGFVSTTQNIDTTTATGKLFFGIFAAFAEFERSMISERTRAGLKLVQETGFNSRGEPSKLGKPEQVTNDEKYVILTRYEAGQTLQSLAGTQKMPLSTVYSIIRRSLVQCEHGKYRCKSCGVTRRAPLRAHAESVG